MSNYTKRAVRGAAIIFVFSSISAVLGYVFRLVLARNLSVAEYGLFWAVVTFTMFVGMIKKLGMDEALTKFVSEYRVKKKFKEIKTIILSVFNIMMISSVVIGVILFLISDFIAARYFHDPSASLIFKILALAIIILRPLSHIFAYVSLGFHRMKYYALFDFTRMVTIMGVTLIGFVFVKSSVVPAIGYLAAPIVVCAIFFPLLLKNVFPNFFRLKAPAFKKETTKRIFKFSIPVMITTASSTILHDTDTLMLTYFSGAVAVGYYNAAMPTAAAITMLFRAITDIIVPFSSELWAKNYKKHLQDGLFLLYKYLFLLVLPISLIIFVFSNFIIRALFGADYLPASVALKVLSVSIILLSMTSINGSFMSGIGKPQFYTKVIIIAAVFNAIFNWILIPKFSFVGASIATSVSYLLMFILTVIQLKKLVRVKLPLAAWFKNIIVAVVFVGVAYLLDKLLYTNALWLKFFVIAVASTAVYVALVFALRIITIKEVKGIVRRVL